MRPGYWRYLAAFAIAICLFSNGPSQASTIQTECCGSNAATGIPNLLVGGTRYHIDFITGNFEQVYGGDQTILSANFAFEVFKALDASPTLISTVADQNGALSDGFFAPDTVCDPNFARSAYQDSCSWNLRSTSSRPTRSSISGSAAAALRYAVSPPLAPSGHGSCRRS